MSDLSREELRDVRMRAADAERLLRDPTLWDVFRSIRATATHATVYGVDAKDREQSRNLVVAIDMLHSELQQRIETAKGLDDAAQRARMFE